MSRDLPNEPWRWSASEIADGVRERRISSTEAVQSCLERIAAVNPAVNALVSVSGEEALEAAAAADRAVAAGGELGPLHGVPVSIKDNVPQAGQVNSGGIVAAARNVAAEDAPTVRHLRAAGAVFVGRSNVPAFSLRWFSENDLYGRTQNPWSAEVTPGGSSGGAAAAVAAGMVPLAHGNDIGGSIRYPAHVCGVAGLRPTAGRVAAWAPVPEMPELPYSSAAMAVQGPIARTVADLRLGLAAMEGLDLADPSFTGAPIALDDPLPGEVRIAVVRDVGLAAPGPAAHRALDAAGGWLRDAGATVEEIELPLLAEAHQLWNLLVIEDLRPELGLIDQLGDEGIKRAIANHVAIAAETWGEPDLTTVLKGQARRSALIHELQRLLSRYTAIMLPGSAGPPAPHGADLTRDGFRELLAQQWPNLAVPVLGMPALAVPTGVGVGDGLPEGVQLLGGRFREGWLLSLGQTLEDAAGRLTPIDPRTAA